MFDNLMTETTMQLQMFTKNVNQNLTDDEIAKQLDVLFCDIISKLCENTLTSQNKNMLDYTYLYDEDMKLLFEGVARRQFFDEIVDMFLSTWNNIRPYVDFPTIFSVDIDVGYGGLIAILSHKPKHTQPLEPPKSIDYQDLSFGEIENVPLPTRRQLEKYFWDYVSIKINTNEKLTRIFFEDLLQYFNSTIGVFFDDENIYRHEYFYATVLYYLWYIRRTDYIGDTNKWNDVIDTLFSVTEQINNYAVY